MHRNTRILGRVSPNAKPAPVIARRLDSVDGTAPLIWVAKVARRPTQSDAMGAHGDRVQRFNSRYELRTFLRIVEGKRQPPFPIRVTHGSRYIDPRVPAEKVLHR